MNARQTFSQQIHALEGVRDRVGPEFDRAVSLLRSKPGKVVVTGIGKSGIVAHKIAATFASTGTPAVFLNAGEALHGDLGMVAADDVVVMVSKSADTAELAHMLPSVKTIGAALVGIFGAAGTGLCAACDEVLDVSVEDEACPLRLAPTTSCTAALVMGDALALAVMSARGFTPEQFAVFHPGGNLGRRLLMRVRDVLPGGDRVAGLSEGSTLREVVEELSDSARGAVALLDGDFGIAGILTEGDIRRQFLEGISPETPAAEVMTRDPKVISVEALLGEALDRMEAGGRPVYVLPAVDVDHRYAGMLRMHDIVGMERR